jgi:hypothetical protein
VRPSHWRRRRRRRVVVVVVGSKGAVPRRHACAALAPLRALRGRLRQFAELQPQRTHHRQHVLGRVAERVGDDNLELSARGRDHGTICQHRAACASAWVRASVWLVTWRASSMRSGGGTGSVASVLKRPAASHTIATLMPSSCRGVKERCEGDGKERREEGGASHADAELVRARTHTFATAQSPQPRHDTPTATRPPRHPQAHPHTQPHPPTRTHPHTHLHHTRCVCVRTACPRLWGRSVAGAYVAARLLELYLVPPPRGQEESVARMEDHLRPMLSGESARVVRGGGAVERMVDGEGAQLPRAVGRAGRGMNPIRGCEDVRM